MSHLFTQQNFDTVNYSLSDNGSYYLNNQNKGNPTYRKTYTNIKIKYCQLVKKKVIYANPTKTIKKITITTMNPDHLKVKNTEVTIQPYSNGQIQLRIYYDHTASKNQQATIKINDGQVTQELVFSFLLFQ